MLEAKCGNLLRAEGVAALREWAEKWDAIGPNFALRRSLRHLLRTVGVRGFPLLKVNIEAGLLESDESFKLIRHWIGQQLLSGKLNRSTKSPCLLTIFGSLIWIKHEFSDSLMSVQVKGGGCWSVFCRSSPILRLPKKATVAHVQTTFLLLVSQFVCAISCPSILGEEG